MRFSPIWTLSHFSHVTLAGSGCPLPYEAGNMAMMEQAHGCRGPTAQDGNFRVTTFDVTKSSTTTTNSLLTPCPIGAYSLLLIEFLFTESPFSSTLIRICVKTRPILHRPFVIFHDACTALPTTICGLKNSVVFGRAIKNQYLALGTFATTFGSAYLATPGGSKTAAVKPKTVQEAKEGVPISATPS